MLYILIFKIRKFSPLKLAFSFIIKPVLQKIVRIKSVSLVYFSAREVFSAAASSKFCGENSIKNKCLHYFDTRTCEFLP